jgi:hypothetical protein
MSVVTGLAGVTQYVLQEALSAYSDEAYTNAKKISGTGIVGTDARIDPSTETFVGQMRWFKPLSPTINIASLTVSTAGTVTDFSSEYAKYTKTVRTHGARKVNMADVISQADGLAKVGRDFGETRAQDEHDAILAVLRGVAVTEMLNGAATGSAVTGTGGQTFDNDPTVQTYGMYVDLGNVKTVIDATTTAQGAARAEGFLKAVGQGYKDYEPPYMYLFTSPEVFASMRSANLVDQDRVTDGQVEFQTLFSGKFRIVLTRANQGFSGAEFGYINTGGAGTNIVGTKTSFLVAPGSVAMAALTVPVPVEMERDAKAYAGGGTTDLWYRWGYMLHPAGYSWAGSEVAFASNAMYSAVPTVNVDTNTRGAWTRKATSALSLGILPVFHA